MKRTYITPSSHAVSAPCHLLESTSGIKIDNNKEVDEQFGKKNGFWDDEEESTEASSNHNGPL